jgi:hypothetical protein
MVGLPIAMKPTTGGGLALQWDGFYNFFHRKKGEEMQHIVFLGNYLYKTPESWYP